MTNLEQLREEIKSKFDQAADAKALESVRLEFLGRKGKIAGLFKELAAMPAQERPARGNDLNSLKAYAEDACRRRESVMAGAGQGLPKHFDPTLPGISCPPGKIHPITRIIREISDIFIRLGFEVVDGREIETEYYNFTALNIPLDHPSRDAFDTFYTEDGHLLRSQTSTVQVRVMKERKPPLRIIAPGRVYRPDAVDASHSFMFHQIEGLMVDDRTTFADLKGVLHVFLRQLFGEDVRLRFRPHFFPFTEPSVEIDINWGKGWLEVLGAGQVDPAVFKAAGYSPRKVQGFAFGLGVERIAMLKFGIKDIRLFYENDLRFLRQF